MDSVQTQTLSIKGNDDAYVVTLYNILTIPNHDLVGLSDRPISRYNTYEEALEAGLQEALKLI